MSKFVMGGIAALLLVSGGLYYWQSRVSGEAPRPEPVMATADLDIPDESGANAFGAAPPMPPEASPQSREERRFARYDRNHDGIIGRNEMLSTRTGAFRKLDKDGNNLLSFEEWAAATVDRFEGADANHDGKLTREEFSSTAPKSAPKPKCKC